MSDSFCTSILYIKSTEFFFSFLFEYTHVYVIYICMLNNK